MIPFLTEVLELAAAGLGLAAASPFFKKRKLSKALFRQGSGFGQKLKTKSNGYLNELQQRWQGFDVELGREC